MSTENIWGSIDFSAKKEESAFDILNKQADYLIEATKGVLKMKVDAIDAYNEENGRPAALYMLHVIAPQIGNIRRKILTVAEYSDVGRFPVDIISHLDNTPMILNVPKDKFIQEIEEILSRPIVKNSIKNLYDLSNENIEKIEEIKNRYSKPKPVAPNQNPNILKRRLHPRK